MLEQFASVDEALGERILRLFSPTAILENGNHLGTVAGVRRHEDGRLAFQLSLNADGEARIRGGGRVDLTLTGGKLTAAEIVGGASVALAMAAGDAAAKAETMTPARRRELMQMTAGGADLLVDEVRKIAAYADSVEFKRVVRSILKMEKERFRDAKPNTPTSCWKMLMDADAHGDIAVDAMAKTLSARPDLQPGMEYSALHEAIIDVLEKVEPTVGKIV